MNKLLSFFFGKKNKKSQNQEKCCPRLSEGIDAYLKARELFFNPENQNRNDERALFLFDLALECGVDSYEKNIFGDRAFCLQGLNYHYEAIEDFDIAIEKQKDDANLFYGRGRSKKCIGDYDGSISDIKKAIYLSSVDNEMNRDYNTEMHKRGWSSVAQIFSSELEWVLDEKESSKKPHLKEMYENKISEVKRRKSQT